MPQWGQKRRNGPQNKKKWNCDQTISTNEISGLARMTATTTIISRRAKRRFCVLTHKKILAAAIMIMDRVPSRRGLAVASAGRRGRHFRTMMSVGISDGLLGNVMKPVSFVLSPEGRVDGNVGLLALCNIPLRHLFVVPNALAWKVRVCGSFPSSVAVMRTCCRSVETVPESSSCLPAGTTK